MSVEAENGDVREYIVNIIREESPDASQENTGDTGVTDTSEGLSSGDESGASDTGMTDTDAGLSPGGDRGIDDIGVTDTDAGLSPGDESGARDTGTDPPADGDDA